MSGFLSGLNWLRERHFLFVADHNKIYNNLNVITKSPWISNGRPLNIYSNVSC